MQKLGSKLMTVFLAIFSIVFTYILGSVIFYNQSRFSTNIPMFVVIIGVLFVIILLYIIYHLLEKWNMKERTKYIYWGMFIIFIIIQSVIAYYLAVQPGWDFEFVYQAAIDDIKGITKIYQNHYFYMYQNNVALVYILKFFFQICKCFGYTNYLFAGIFLNMICIDLSIYFIYKIIDILWSKRSNILLFLLLLTTLPFLTMVPIFYTDTIVLPFITIPLYIYIYMIKNKDIEKKKKYIMYIVSGLLLGIGCQIKFTIIILLIAYLVYLFVSTNIMKLWKEISVLFISILLVFIPVTLVRNRIFDQNIIDNVKVPLTHWIMMGLNNEGSFNYEDNRITNEAGNYKEKKQTNIKHIKSRLKTHIKNGTLLQFYTKKMSFLWSDGTYYAPAILIPPVHKNVLHDIVISNTPYFDWFYILSQIQHILMMVMILLSIGCTHYLKDEQKEIRNFLCITIFGTILFFLLWEVSSRYLVHMLPVLIVTSYIGMMGCFSYIDEKIFPIIQKIKQKNK